MTMHEKWLATACVWGWRVCVCENGEKKRAWRKNVIFVCGSVRSRDHPDLFALVGVWYCVSAANCHTYIQTFKHTYVYSYILTSLYLYIHWQKKRIVVSVGTVRYCLLEGRHVGCCGWWRWSSIVVFAGIFAFSFVSSTFMWFFLLVWIYFTAVPYPYSQCCEHTYTHTHINKALLLKLPHQYQWQHLYMHKF